MDNDKEENQVEKKKEEKGIDKNEKKALRKEKLKKRLPIILLIILVFIFGFLFTSVRNANLELSKNLNKEVKSEQDILSRASSSALNEYGLRLEKANLESYLKTNNYMTISDLQNLVMYNNGIVCEVSESYTDGTVYLSNCKYKDAVINYSYGTKKDNIVESSGVEVEADETVLIFKVGGYGTVYYLTRPNSDNYETIRITAPKISDSNPTIIAGKYLYYMDSDYHMQVVDIESNQKVLANENYTGIYLIGRFGYSNGDYAAILKDKKYYLYNLKDNVYIDKDGYDDINPYIAGCGVTGPLNGVVRTLNNSDNIVVIRDGKYGIVDYTNGNAVVPVKYDKFLSQGSLIIATAGEKQSLFGGNGKEFLSQYNFDRILGVSNDSYVFASKDNRVKLYLLNGDELYDYGEMKVKGLHMGSPAYDVINVELIEAGDSTGCIDVKYDISTKKGTFEKKECAGISKPILYFYPQKDIDVKVTFDHPEYLNTTYPKYNNGWEVSAKTDGSLYDKNGKYYYALYWDEEKIHSVDFSEGFYVTKSNAIDFLEEKLSYIGLNDKEKNEFIMYWLPILEKNKKNLVYFELTEERNSYSKINITPKPDSMLRLVIHVKKVSKKVDIKEEKLTSFERDGYHVVEWGGTTY